MKIQALSLAFLAATAIGGLAWVFIYPAMSGQRKAEHRRASLAKSETPARQADKSQRSRREQVEGSLKDVEARRRKEKKLPLSSRLVQAGLAWSTQKFMIVSGVLAAVSFSLAMLFGGGLLAAVGLAFAAGFGLPRWMLNFLKKRREKNFLQRAAGRRRRDRSRHQGGPAAVRIASRSSPPTRRSRSRASSWPSSKPRRSACRSARPARDCSNGCRYRRPTSSAS